MESPFRPFEGKKRVYIFEEADRMNPTAANTLLKTLEEPPTWTVLVLLTAHEAAILPTLRSRCQRIRFLPLLPEEVAELLVREHEVSRQRASLAAAVSGGSLSKALAASTEKLDALHMEAFRVASVPAEATGHAELITRAGKLAKAPALNGILRLALCLLRDLASTASGGVTLHNQVTDELASLAHRVPLEVWLEGYLQVEQALYDMEIRYTNKRITLEQMLVKLAGLRTETLTTVGPSAGTRST
jgi:DNA polymerase-3 subunit delta'